MILLVGWLIIPAAVKKTRLKRWGEKTSEKNVFCWPEKKVAHYSRYHGIHSSLISPVNKSFKASDGWVRRFMERE